MGITMEEDLSGFYILKESSVSVDSVKKYTNFRRTITVEGGPEHVVMKIAELLKQDCWTPMYGDMRLTIEDIQMVGGKMTVVLSKDHYAGV
jgi:hypothetical protein